MCVCVCVCVYCIYEYVCVCVCVCVCIAYMSMCVFVCLKLKSQRLTHWLQILICSITWKSIYHNPLYSFLTHQWVKIHSLESCGRWEECVNRSEKPEFLQVMPLTMKILLRWWPGGIIPKTSFCFNLSSGVSAFSPSQQERHFPLSAVLTAPHAAHCSPPYPCPFLRDFSAGSCSAQGPDSIHSCRLDHQS